MHDVFSARMVGSPTSNALGERGRVYVTCIFLYCMLAEAIGDAVVS